MVRLFNTLRRSVMPQCVRTLRKNGTAVVHDNMLMTPNGPLSTTQQLHVVDTTQGARWPVYRIMKHDGQLEQGVAEPKDVNEELSVKMYCAMVQIQVLDEIMNLAQRQGRISFYMQAAGEEAIHIGKYYCTAPIILCLYCI